MKPPRPDHSWNLRALDRQIDDAMRSADPLKMLVNGRPVVGEIRNGRLTWRARTDADGPPRTRELTWEEQAEREAAAFPGARRSAERSRMRMHEQQEAEMARNREASSKLPGGPPPADWPGVEDVRPEADDRAQAQWEAYERSRRGE